MVERYKKLLAFLAGSSLLLLFVIMLVTTISRYFFNTSILWGEEFCKYSMIYGVMFAMSLCYLEGLHIKFSLLDSIQSKTFQKFICVFIDLSVLASSIILTWSGYLFVAKRGAIQSPGIGISMYYFQSALIVGGVCLFIAAVFRLISHVQVPCRARMLKVNHSDI